jgi:hypothetical protein
MALLTPVRSAAAASPEQLIERASTWYAEQCSDPEKELFPSDESNGLLRALQASNEESGEPTLLAWHGLVSICTGDREVGQANLDLFKAIAGKMEPALTARIDLELGLRDGQCRAATSAASRLAKEGKTADDWRAVLLVRTRCKTSCPRVVDTAEQLEGLGGDSSAFGRRVDACRSELAREKTELAREKKQLEFELAREKKQLEFELAREKKLAGARAAGERRRAEQERKQAEARAARTAELTPQFDAVKLDYQLARKRSAPAKALGAIGLVGGGVLVGVGTAFRVQADLAATAAAGAETWVGYGEQVGLIDKANTSLSAFFGGGTALLTSGVVAAIVSGVQAKKHKATRERYEALRRELDELEDGGGR